MTTWQPNLKILITLTMRMQQNTDIRVISSMQRVCNTMNEMSITSIKDKSKLYIFLSKNYDFHVSTIESLLNS